MAILRSLRAIKRVKTKWKKCLFLLQIHSLRYVCKFTFEYFLILHKTLFACKESVRWRGKDCRKFEIGVVNKLTPADDSFTHFCFIYAHWTIVWLLLPLLYLHKAAAASTIAPSSLIYKKSPSLFRNLPIFLLLLLHIF